MSTQIHHPYFICPYFILFPKVNFHVTICSENNESGDFKSDLFPAAATIERIYHMTPHVPPFRRRSRQNIPSHPEHPPGEHSPVHAPIPGLGLRSIKTALATVLTALLYAFFPNSNPTFACIGAIFGMGADMEDSRRSGGNRFFGTIIGGFIGLGLYWLEHLIYPEGNYWLRLPLISLGVVAMISICVLFHWPGGVQPGGVVLCIILFNTPAHHIDYAVNRMIDTGVGVVIALLVNYLLPRSRVERWFHLDHRETANKAAEDAQKDGAGKEAPEGKAPQE